MWTKLQLLALRQPALRAPRCLARTAWRRPLWVAAATGLAMLQVLPGGEPVLPVQIVDPSGVVEQAFALAVDDPRLESLRRAAEEASHPDYRQRTPDYYRAQWDAETAAFYLADSRRRTAAHTAAAATGAAATGAAATGAAATGAAATGERSSTVVSPVSYQIDSAASVAHAAGAVERDWVAFWGELRETSTARMRSLEPAPRVDPMFARMQFGSVVPGPYPTPTVFTALCFAVVGFLATARWACRPPRRLIGLRTAQQLEVPAEWIRQRRSWRELRTAWTVGRSVEGAAVVVVLVLLMA